jgi:hypothetical protein
MPYVEIAMTGERLQRWTQYAAILGAVVTAGSMVFGVLTYRRGVVEQRQNAATGILQEYLKLSVEHPDLAGRGSDQPMDAKYVSFAMHALFTAETLWRLVGEDEKWQGTIDAIIRQHRGYMQQGVLACDGFLPEFLNYMRMRVPELQCAETGKLSKRDQ